MRATLMYRAGDVRVVRVPDARLIEPTDALISITAESALTPSLITLCDVMGTGHHAAVSARVSRGRKAAVIGDGAVGLCASSPAAQRST